MGKRAKVPEEQLTTTTEEELTPSDGQAVSVRAASPTFITRGKLRMRQVWKDATDWGVLRRTPYGLTPALLLALAGVVQGFDSTAFGLIAPDLVRDLELDLPKVLIALNIVGFLLIFVHLGFGFLLDRVRRVPYVAAASTLSGIFSIFTSRANSIPSLGVSRVGDAISSDVASLPRFSLLSDYYPPEVRGKMFALLGTLQRFAVLGAPLLIGVLVTSTTNDPDHPNWRIPFLITGPLLVIVGIILLLKLKEPIRGYMERKALGLDEEVAKEPEPTPSFGEAWRITWAIRTLRRFFIAVAISEVGAIIYVRLYLFYFQERYGLDAFERGVVAFIGGIGVLVGGFFGGGIVDSLTRRRPQRVLIFYGLLGMASSIFYLIQALGPPLPLLVTGTVFAAFFGALLGPAGNVVIAQVVPAHVRSTGLAVFVLTAVPATLIFFGVAGQLPNWGLQGGMMASVPFFFIGSLIFMSAADVFDRDMRSALASQAASQEYRVAKEMGEGKLLVCRDVDVEYDGVQVLFGVDFDVEEGEIIALLGTNGAGKSTLLKAIGGTQEASGGAIVADGREITHMPPHEIAARGIILMPGGKGIFPGLSVSENLTLGHWMIDSKVASGKLEEIYRIFPILKERANERAGLLSGGEQQMLSLSQAFLSEPKLLMIDELSLGLSPAVVGQLIEIVKAIHSSGTTIILVEQSVNVALTVAEKAIFMEKGEVKFVGKTKDLLSRPDILRAVYVKGTGALSGGTPSGALKSDRELRRYELEQARPILEVKSLSKSFGGVTAVSNVSFDLREGEILGLIGPNGAGKTTVFDLITGYQIPDSGQVLFDGEDVSDLGPDARAKKKLLRRFQDAKLFPSLSVYENILVSLEQKLEVRNVALTALQLPQVRQSEKRVRLRADRLIELLDLGAFRDKFVKELSTGLRRITDLACVLAVEPKVLLLDEPSTGIAQAEAEMLAPLLRRVRFETGCSILMIEHDMSLISSISDELLAMDQGRVVIRGLPDDVLNDETVVQSYLGTSEDVINRSGVMKGK